MAGTNDFDIRKIALTHDQTMAMAAVVTGLRRGSVEPCLTLIERFGHDMGHEIARRAVIITEKSRYGFAA